MDAFEQLVSEILWMEGLWVRTSVKVEITKEEKRLIGRPSSPRWEIDIVAYSGRDNLLYAVECKSYLDSRGVRLCGFDGTDPNTAAVQALLRRPAPRGSLQPFEGCSLQRPGACPPDARVQLCLACGRIASDKDRQGLRDHFAARGWLLWDEPWLREKLMKMSVRDTRTKSPPWSQNCCCEERPNRDIWNRTLSLKIKFPRNRQPSSTSDKETKAGLDDPRVRNAFENIAHPSRSTKRDWFSTVELGVVPIQLGQR
jgi:hypothetical protein